MKILHTRKISTVTALLLLTLTVFIVVGLAWLTVASPFLSYASNELWLPILSDKEVADNLKNDQPNQDYVINSVQKTRSGAYDIAYISGVRIYEVGKSQKFKPYECPSIFGFKDNPASFHSSEPIPCRKIGTSKNSDVYAKKRSFGTPGTTEVFVELDNTFVAFTIGSTDRQEDILYFLSKFKKIPQTDLSSYLDKNEQIKQDIASEIQAKKEAYKNLDFKTMLPNKMPTGWRLATDILEIRGTDVRHPTQLNMSYKKKDENSQPIAGSMREIWMFVSLHKTSEVSLNEHSCQYLSEYNLPPKIDDCQLVPGKDYYASVTGFGSATLTKTVYKQIGDTTVIISFFNEFDNLNATESDLDQRQLDAQQQMIESMQPVSPDEFKQATFTYMVN